MLTEEEKGFIAYWEQKRMQKKSIWQFSFGLPLGVLIIALVFVNIITGWHKRAAAVLRANNSLIITILIAAVGIVVFITIFTNRYNREQQEQRYQELLGKMKNDAANPVENNSII